MNKIIFTVLLLIAPLCKAADYSGIIGHVVTAQVFGGLSFPQNLPHRIAQYMSYYSKIYTARLYGSLLLELDGYRLTEIPDLNLHELQTLDLNNNLIKSIANLHLPWLTELWLNNNLIADIIPDDLNLNNLEVLRLNNNLIESIANLNLLPSLRQLYLNNNKLTALPDRDLPELRYFELRNNLIAFIDPQVLGQFPNLQVLDLEQNHLQQDNIDDLRTYAEDRGNLTIIFGEQKGGPGIKRAKR